MCGRHFRTKHIVVLRNRGKHVNDFRFVVEKFVLKHDGLRCGYFGNERNPAASYFCFVFTLIIIHTRTHIHKRTNNTRAFPVYVLLLINRVVLFRNITIFVIRTWYNWPCDNILYYYYYCCVFYSR